MVVYLKLLSVISWWYILLLEETGVLVEKKTKNLSLQSVTNLIIILVMLYRVHHPNAGNRTYNYI